MGTAGLGGGTEQEQARSAEDAREYVQQVRSLPVDQVIRDVLFTLLNAAQVKLGQLRLGQVSAEGHASQQGEPEENDLRRRPAPPSSGAAQ
jgi:hypothetical protein